MALRRFLLAVAGVAAFSVAAHAAPPAAVSAYLPTTCKPGVAGDCVRAIPVTNPDGSPIGGGGGGTSGGTATAAAPTYTEGSTSQPLSMNLAGDLRVISKQSGTWNVGITGTLPAFAATPTFNIGTLNGAATAANQTSVQSAPGTSATSANGVQGVTNGVPILLAGKNPAGNTTAAAVGTNGGLLPGQGIVTTTRTTLTANTATALETAGVSTRIAESIFVEATTTAPIYICSTQTTTCSATVYDFLIPTGATAGAIYTPIFATTGRLYAYSTGTPVIGLNSWVGQ